MAWVMVHSKELVDEHARSMRSIPFTRTCAKYTTFSSARLPHVLRANTSLTSQFKSIEPITPEKKKKKKAPQRIASRKVNRQMGGRHDMCSVTG